jgi:hypothetical protein
VTLTEAQTRRKALWNARCACSGPLHHCRCLDTCETCGHLRVDHDYDGAEDTHRHWGGCEIDDCTCARFQVDDED